MGLDFFLIGSILEATGQIFHKFGLFFGRFEGKVIFDPETLYEFQDFFFLVKS